MSADAKYMPHVRETALSVDFAFGAMEDDIRAELARSGQPSDEALGRLLSKLQERRAALAKFTLIVAKIA